MLPSLLPDLEPPSLGTSTNEPVSDVCERFPNDGSFDRVDDDSSLPMGFSPGGGDSFLTGGNAVVGVLATLGDAGLSLA